MNYLYNDVGPLPDIYSVYTPELQATHPFACVCYLSNTLSSDNPTPCFCYSATQQTVNVNGVMYIGGLTRYLVVDGEWVQSNTFANAQPFWSNYDIYYADNQANSGIYLAASDPVPVSPVQINPALLVQSFFTGQAIRRSRK